MVTSIRIGLRCTGKLFPTWRDSSPADGPLSSRTGLTFFIFSCNFAAPAPFQSTLTWPLVPS